MILGSHKMRPNLSVAKMLHEKIMEYLQSIGFKGVFDRNPIFMNTQFEHLASSIFIHQQG